jgi:hypothetical protein
MRTFADKRWGPHWHHYIPWKVIKEEFEKWKKSRRERLKDA